MRKAIEIEELRISPDGLYLEFIINCPSDYQFTTFNIQKYGDEEIFSIADDLFYDDSGDYITDTDNKFMGQVPVSLLYATGPEMYTIYISADHNALELHPSVELPIEPILGENAVPDTIETIAYISDVSKVYRCLAKDIMRLTEHCIDAEVEDRVIRNYLVLYAHLEALRLGHVEEAHKWFVILQSCFSPCGKPKGHEITGNISNHNLRSCGCLR